MSDLKKRMQQLMTDLVTDLSSTLKSGAATAADRNVIRQLLKDHNIEVPQVPGNPLEPLAGALTDSLPFAQSGMEH